MDRTDCIPIEQLAALDSLPADAPELRHVARCPRCRARRSALAEFTRPEVLPAEAHAAEAGARLDAFIDDLVAPQPAPARASRRGPFAWLAPAWRPVFALAVLAVVAGGVWMTTRSPGVSTLRGEPDLTFTLSLPRAIPEGWTLEWPARPGAESYDVLFLATDLREIARIPNVNGTHFVLRRDALPAGLTLAPEQFWQVIARKDGVEISRSAPAPLALD